MMWPVLFLGAVAAPLPEMSLRLPDVKFDAYELCWPSGLKVVAVRRPNTALVSVTAVVSGGWAAEQQDERGAAHLVEHLWFQSRPQGSFAVDDVLSGLSYNAQTWPDTTIFTTIASPEDLSVLLNIEALRLIDPLVGLTEEEVLDERRVVHNEHLWRSEHVAGVAYQELYRALFPEGSPYRHQPSIAQNDTLTLDALTRYARRQYRPENTTIRLEGEVSPAELQSLVSAVFPPSLLQGTQTSCLHPSASADPPPRVTEAVSTVTAPTDPTLMFGWSLPAGFVASNDAMGQMAADWLQDSLAYSIGVARGMDDTDVALSCGYQPMQHGAVLACSTPLSDKADPDAVAKRIGSVLDERRRELSADVDWLLQTVGAFDEALEYADSFSLDALSARGQFTHHTDGEIDPLFRTLRSLYKGDPKQLAAFSERWLTRERMAAVALVYGGVEEQDSTTIDGTAVLEVTKRGPWHAPTISLEGWRAIPSADGIDVWVISRPSGPPHAESALLLSVDGAAGAEGAWWADQSLADFDMPRAIDIINGTATLFDWSSEPGAHLVSALGPSGNLDAQMYAIRNLLGPIRYLGRASDLRTDHKAAREALAENPWRFARATREQHLFPQHPYGMAWWDLDESAAKRTRSEVMAWRRGLVRPENGTLVVSGRVTADEVLSVTERYLGPWEVKGEPIGREPRPQQAKERRIYGLEWGYPLLEVHVACRIEGRTAETDAVTDVVSLLLERGMQQTLRDRGGAYGISVAVAPFDRASATIDLYAQVGQGSGRPAVDAMLGLLAQIAAGPSEPLLDWAKGAALHRHAERLASASAAQQLAMEAVAAGLRLEELAAWPERLRAVDAKKVTSLLSPCVGREVATVVGPRGDLGERVEWVNWQLHAQVLAK